MRLRHAPARVVSKAEVARALGVARRDVYDWIASGRLDRESDEAQARHSAGSGACRRMVVAIADKAANASTEGGFLGFGGVQVSDKAQAFIQEVKRATCLA